MIKSMTGYGNKVLQNENAYCQVEIKSLNSKYMELSLRLPKTLSDKELILRNECSKLFERGKISITISVEYTDQLAGASTINTDLLKRYYKQLKSVAEELGDENVDVFRTVVNIPDVINNKEETTVDEFEFKDIMNVFREAAQEFEAFRIAEGKVLSEDLSNRTKMILKLLREVESLESDRIPLIKERLIRRIDEAVGKENLDLNRFEQELIYHIEKLDITEEKIRLTAHCNYFIETLSGKDSNGKKLGFISQEMGREINTLGSKANHSGIQQIVVQMKEELEKIKEQILNVL